MSLTELSDWPEIPPRPAFGLPGVSPAAEAAQVARAPAEAPGRDPIRAALAADARHAPREAWLGLALATLVVLLVVEGWLWPMLAIAFCAAPVIGILLESWDALQDRPEHRNARRTLP